MGRVATIAHINGSVKSAIVLSTRNTTQKIFFSTLYLLRSFYAVLDAARGLD